MTSPEAVGDVFQRWQAGDPAALDALMPLMYERLRTLARQRLRHEPDASLNTTGLVHEAYLRLIDSPPIHLANHAHFLGVATRVMRHILVDEARARRAAKRGANVRPVSLEENIWIPDDAVESVLELDEALERLGKLDERRCRILEQHYFGGLTIAETAETTGLSSATVKRELRAARAWLALALGSE